MHPLPILLTRPEADARRLAARLWALGAGQVEISPLLRIEPVGAVPLDLSALLLTSANAVAAVGALPRGVPAWVVGPRTAEMAARAGADVRGVAAEAAALIAMVPADAPPLTHLRGSVARGDVAGGLRARGLSVSEVVVYRQVPQALSAVTLTLLASGPCLVPVYSPRSAELLGQACPAEAWGNLRLLALSEAVAEACPVLPMGVSERPDGKSMIDLIQRALLTIRG